MRKGITIVTFAVMACLLGGCDFLRQLAGRPTSREIEARLARIERAEEARQRQQDSLEALQRHLSDSLAREDSLRQAAGSLLSLRSIPLDAKKRLEYRYYLMIGAFRTPAYAQKQAARARKAGCEVTLIPFADGVTGVGICPSNSLSKVYDAMYRLQWEPFYPDDAWVLVNE